MNQSGLHQARSLRFTLHSRTSNFGRSSWMTSRLLDRRSRSCYDLLEEGLVGRGAFDQLDKLVGCLPVVLLVRDHPVKLDDRFELVLVEELFFVAGRRLL